MNNWMQISYDALKDKKIYELMLPGTHDSCAYRLEEPWFIKCLVNNWTKTQDLTIFNQLILGIRSLDIRLSYKNNKFYASHTFICCLLDDVFFQIKSFLQQNPFEILILHIKPDYKTPMSTPEEFLKYLEESDIHHYVNDINKDYEDIKISDVISTNKRIFIFSDFVSSLPSLFKIYKSIRHIWHDQTDPQKLIDLLNNDFIFSPTCVEFVLTPNASFIFKNLFSSVKKLASQINPKVDMIFYHPQLKKAHVVNLDFPNKDLIRLIIDQNFIVKL